MRRIWAAHPGSSLHKCTLNLECCGCLEQLRSNHCMGVLVSHQSTMSQHVVACTASKNTRHCGRLSLPAWLRLHLKFICFLELYELLWKPGYIYFRTPCSNSGCTFLKRLLFFPLIPSFKSNILFIILTGICKFSGPSEQCTVLVIICQYVGNSMGRPGETH